MKFSSLFTAVAAVLFASLQTCVADWDTCAPNLYCDVDADCRIKRSCLKIAYNHDPSYIHCYVSFIHPRTCWAWTTDPGLDGLDGPNNSSQGLEQYEAPNTLNATIESTGQ